MGAHWMKQLHLPAQDPFKSAAYKTCAVVGNSMNMFDAKNGAAIDAHDAVFRFNREDRRMAHVKNMTLVQIAEYMGEKTTVRFVNRKYTDSLVNGDAAASDYKENDIILFWNLFTAPYLNHIQERYPHVQMHLIATDLVQWQLNGFSQLRKDLYRLGMGPFECYRFMSSGVHGLLLAMLTCETIDMFGFSVSLDNFAQSFNHGRPSESHSWDFETVLMRLLYFSGAINVCNA
uniref:Uncharacterized protein n=1 Tax=Pyramimonas obovata TaxID=1411642 RepID=A0A7S0MSG1_9CHLO